MTARLDTQIEGLGLTGALRLVADCFSRTGMESPEADARMLVLGATGLDRNAFIRNPDQRLSETEARALSAFVQRRLAGEPATRILGSRFFWTLDLEVTSDVLDPRPDSETIIEATLGELGARKSDPLHILDLGTGSGALLLSLLAECPNAQGIGVDLSASACAVARRNAVRNGLETRAEVRQGRWTDGLLERFDVIISNPPYIPSRDIDALSPEVRQHDPLLALDGGADGIDAYREIVASLRSTLKQDGFAVLELGIGQAGAVMDLGRAAGMRCGPLRRDLGGVDRALVLYPGQDW